MLQTNIVEKNKTHILCPITFFPKSGGLWDNVEKFCRAGLAQMRVWRMRISCGTTKTADIHSQYLLPCHCNNGCTKASQYYDISTLPVLLKCV